MKATFLILLALTSFAFAEEKKFAFHSTGSGTLVVTEGREIVTAKRFDQLLRALNFDQKLRKEIKAAIARQELKK